MAVTLLTLIHPSLEPVPHPLSVSTVNSGDDLTLTEPPSLDTLTKSKSATLTVCGDASIAGCTAGVYADSATVTAIGASVDGGSTGTGLMVDGDTRDLPTGAASDVGVYAENTEFRWDGGTSTATTHYHAVESVGWVEPHLVRCYDTNQRRLERIRYQHW